MKRIKVAALLLPAMLLAPLLAACGADNQPVSVADVQPAPLQAPHLSGRHAPAELAAAGANKFAFQLSAALAKDVGAENFVCSPYSVWLPLAALINATDEEYKSTLKAALNDAALEDEYFNEAASRMLYDLTNERDKEMAEEYGDEYYHDPLKIVNAIFVDNKVTLSRDFAQTFADYYRGSVMNVDFASPAAAQAVNEWASDNTDGLINHIVDKFDGQTVAAIANAIYFSDRWEWEFDPEHTNQNVFYAPGGETTAHYMLREGDHQLYYEDELVQAMPLSFKTGGGMYIILPKDGDAVSLLTSMDADYFQRIQNKALYENGKLLLPRFSIEGDTMQLADTLTALGVPLFDEASAPLTGGLIKDDTPVWLSAAVHKAVIEVDEKGTTAAAVTVMPAVGAAPPQPSEPFEMICDKPFVFVLYAHTYDGGNQVLFTGLVQQP